MSFCRITGKARGLPRPNYFPILPPISPADAKRFCRITGKAYGLPGHHYTPVLLVRQNQKVKDRVTGNAASKKHSSCPEPQRHVVIADFRYVFPALEMLEQLEDFIVSEKPEVLDGKQYVYTVEERCCNVVIPARLEAAVRDGQLRGVLLADEMDKVCFQFRRGKDVTVDVCEMTEPDGHELFDGEGPSKPAEIVKPKKNKRKKSEGFSCMTKIFEEKERVQDVEALREEEVKTKRSKVVEMKISASEPSSPPPPPPPSMTGEARKQLEKIEWNEFDERFHRVDVNLVMCSGNWRDLLQPLIESWNWEEFEQEAASVSAGDAIIADLPDPVPINTEVVDLRLAVPGLVSQPATSEHFTPLPPASSSVPLVMPEGQPDASLFPIIRTLSENVLNSVHAGTVAAAIRDNAHYAIPDLKDIPKLIKALDAGESCSAGDNSCGHIVDMNAAKIFVPGISVDAPSGPTFIPGQTIDIPGGKSFIPGLTVLTEDKPVLLPGLVIKNQAGPSFVTGRVVATRTGESFVPGQMVDTPAGPRFMPGQTVTTDEGPKFIAGQTIPLPEGSAKFIPGHTVTSAEGSKFVPGQMLPGPDGNCVFVPGQTVHTENGGWQFVPGQTLLDNAGKLVFVAGQSQNTEEGEQFVPGRVVNTGKGPCFVPGVTVEGKDGSLRFVAGRSVETSDGTRFVEGRVLCSDGRDVFVPGRETLTDDGTPTFIAARSIEDAIVEETVETGIVAEVASASAALSRASQITSNAVFGHMVQTASGVEFFPGPKAEGLPAGKVVPGQLHRSIETGDMHFVPGIELIEDGGACSFVPGQVVETQSGEQFVPGQVVDTENGPKFIPGQVVETSMGPKFVPGQTVDTPEGARFIPGQIVDTKVGPTFIPGQIISTPEGTARFVPGEVINTSEGLRFVPGRVIETNDRVKFVPGHVVETKEGLRFVAPDLIDGHEFHVQGFEVTPEELHLLRPVGVAAGHGAAIASVDAHALQRLAAAGIAIGRHAPVELSNMDMTADTVLASATVQALAERLSLQPDDSIKLFEVLHLIARLSSELLSSAGSSSTLRASQPITLPTSDESIEAFLRSLVFAVALAMSHEPTCRALDCAAAVLDELLVGVEPEASSALVQSIYTFFSFPGALHELRSTASDSLRAQHKLEMLRTLVSEPMGKASVAEGLASVLGEGRGEEALGEAFVRLSEFHPDLVERVLGKVSLSAGDVVTEREAVTAVQTAIVSSVQESSEQQVRFLLSGHGCDSEEAHTREEELHDLITQAVALARALGLFEAAHALLEVLEDPATTSALAYDTVAMDVLKRLTLMRTLSQRRPAHADALRRLQKDPYEARGDPHLCELVRESAILMVASNRGNASLTSAADVPASLLLSDNQLAVEDFLAHEVPHSGPLLILKPGLQKVIPREASRAVLTGQVAYTVLDAKGIRHFAPLHVLSALRLPHFTNHRFTMYQCFVDESSLTTSLTSSCEDLTSRRGSWAVDSMLDSSVSTRRRSGDLKMSQRCTSRDTGTGTVTGSQGSEESIGIGHTNRSSRSARASLSSGYLDSETRLRIAAALAGRPLLQKSRIPSRSSSLSSLTEASTSPLSSQLSPPDSTAKSRETSPCFRTSSRSSQRNFLPVSELRRKNSLVDLTPNQRRILEELRRNSFTPAHRRISRVSGEDSLMSRKLSCVSCETSPPSRYVNTHHKAYRNYSPSPPQDACPTFHSSHCVRGPQNMTSSSECSSSSLMADSITSDYRDLSDLLVPAVSTSYRPRLDTFSHYTGKIEPMTQRLEPVPPSFSKI